MNKKSLSLKVDEYTIHLHRGQEESEETKQKRMALYIACLLKIVMKPIIKHFEEYYPELQPKVSDILKKVEDNLLDYEIQNLNDFK